MIDLINKFIAIQELLLAQTPMQFIRELYGSIDWHSRLVGIVGPRGVGKTTIMLQHIARLGMDRDRVLYLSADSILLGKSSLFELAQVFHLQGGGKVLYIDEVHRCQNWSQELKSIYDSLPKLKVVFSGSSQINIIKGRSDLARRAVMYTVPGLSFREYLKLKQLADLPVLKLSDLVENHQEISTKFSETDSLLKHFRDYIELGYYPYFLENKDIAIYYKLILNSTDKSIYEDIALASNLQTENLVAFKELLVFLSSITPGEVSIHKIAKNINKKDDTVKSYLQMLHDTSLLRFLPNSLAGHAKLKSAEKIFFDNTNLLNAFCYFTGKPAETGLVRETFTIGQLQSAGLIPLHSKTGDIKVKDFIFEIGGKSKSKNQIQGVANSYLISDEILISGSRRIPLHLFGFLY